MSTRWNSTYEMLVFALEYRKPIDKISGDKEMRKYELDEKEWELVRQLCDVLEVRDATSLSFSILIYTLQLFKDATLFFSRATPHLATVIPAMDHIDAHLATAIRDLAYSPAIRASLALGKDHLNKYYDMSDDSEVYRISMSKYSTLKLFYLMKMSFNSLTPTIQAPVFP